MFRFLRKYNKWILAVAGTLLLIVFLAQGAITGLSRYAGRASAAWATVGPEGRETVTQGDLAEVQQELQLFERLGVRYNRITVLGLVDDPGHWYLLTREAEAAGVMPSPSSIYRSLPEPRDQTLGTLASLAGSRADVVLRALAKREGVDRMVSLYQGGDQFSDRRLRQHARRAFAAVDADIVVIKAAPQPADTEPGEADIEQQLEAYADVAPGEGEKGFGYRLPDRVKLEWMTVPLDSVRRMIEASDRLDGVALRKHWRLNPDGLFPTVDTSQPVPDVVRSDLLERLADETMDEIAKFAYDRLRAQRRGLPEDSGYLVLGSDWEQRQLSFFQLAQEIQGEFGVDLPSYESTGQEWLERDDLNELPGFGTATTTKFGPIPVGLGDLVAAAKEFGGSTTVVIQEAVAAPPLRDAAGDVYLFRIIDTDASRPPESADEVRDQVIADLNRLAHYQRLADTADEVAAAARTRGLLAVALENNSRIERAIRVSIFDERLGVPTPLPTIGVHGATVEAIVDRALSAPEGTLLSNLPPEQQIFVLPIEDQLALAIVRLQRLTPLSESRYGQLVSQGLVQTMILSEELDGGEVMRQAFSFDAMADRHNFEFVAAATQTSDADADA
ncbi:MAG: hypothetical protein ACYSTY_08935, partial [Planctomycetota bacterium]